MLPDADPLAVARSLGASVLSDVLDGLGHRHQCLGWDIVPVCGAAPDRTVAGYAFPLAVEPVDAPAEVPYVGLLAALDAVQAEAMVVIPTGRSTNAAVWGELLSTACRARGATGAITDGLVRDAAQVDELGFPVFARGTHPTDIDGRLEVVGHGVAGEIDGVSIAPGDLIVADVDGVVVVPAALVDDAVARAVEKSDAERAFQNAVADGMLPSEAYRTYGVL